MRLTDDDYAALERCFITRAIAQAAGLYRVPSIEGRDLVGRHGAGNFGGTVYSYRFPGDPAVVAVRLRLDHPPVDAASGKAQIKYLSPPGQRNHIYFPLADPAALADVTIPLVFTEGEKKGLALFRAAIEGAAILNGSSPGQPLFVAAALAGVWGWRGGVGIATDAQGRRVPEKGVIPDFDRIPWSGRKVLICFDTNVATNEMVREARRQLARELERRGAVVYFIDLPAGPGINGVDDYLAANGLLAFLSLYQTATRYDWYDELARNEKGKVLASFSNALTALRLAPEWHGVLGYNEFALRIENRRSAPWGAPPGAWSDHQDLLTVEWLERKGIRLSRSQTSDAVMTVAHEEPFHPVHDYLNSLVWDGVGRLDDWLTLYLGADPSDYTRAVGRCWMISAVARIYDPGCKADHTLILEGIQGAGKSTAFSILGGEFYSDDMPELGTKDSQLNAGASWIIELSELDAMGRADVSKIKSFLSRREDRFRPPYGRHPVTVPRHCIFGGSVNLFTGYLKDETGGRRFWPVKCGRLNLEALARDRDQLWAEAVARYRKGEHWWLDTPDLVTAATEEQEQRFQTHPWEEKIAKWLVSQSEVTTADVLTYAVQKETAQWTRRDEIDVGAILHRLGWEVAGRGPRTSGSTRRRIYREKVAPAVVGATP